MLLRQAGIDRERDSLIRRTDLRARAAQGLRAGDSFLIMHSEVNDSPYRFIEKYWRRASRTTSLLLTCPRFVAWSSFFFKLAGRLMVTDSLM